MEQFNSCPRKHSIVAVSIAALMGVALIWLEFGIRGPASASTTAPMDLVPARHQLPAEVWSIPPDSRASRSLIDTAVAIWHDHKFVISVFYTVVLMKVLVLKQSMTEFALCAVLLGAFAVKHLIAVQRLLLVELQRSARDLRRKAGPNSDVNNHEALRSEHQGDSPARGSDSGLERV